MDSHPIHRLYTSGTQFSLVSKLYSLITQSTAQQLAVCRSWKKDLGLPNINWSKVWSNIQLASRNPYHQMIHHNFVMRTHFTPQKLAKFSPNHSPNCSFCPQGTPGTYMMWDCTAVNTFWHSVSSALSTIVGKNVPSSPAFLLLNDDSGCDFPIPFRRIILAGITAAKKLVAMRWKQPHSLGIPQWYLSFMDILSLESSVAKIHGAKQDNVKMLNNVKEQIKGLIA